MRIYCFLIVILVSCHEYPRDPENTLSGITGGTLTVGYSENHPWVVKTTGDPEGVEAEALKLFAGSLNAGIVWVNDTEQELFRLLEKRKIDIVIAGLTDKTPWKKEKITLTRAYYTTKNQKHVMAIVQGENRFQITLEIFLHKLGKDFFMQTTDGR